MSLLTPFKRASGLGPTNDGVHHWWMQKLTAVALVPLSFWFAFAVAKHAGDDYQAIQAWIASPYTTTMLTLTAFTTFLHAAQGLQVIIEDYLHNEGVKFAAMIAMKLGLFALGVSSVLSILRIAFVG